MSSNTMDTEAESLPTETIVSGLSMAEKVFIWKVENVDVIMKQESLINNQIITFEAGASIKHPSTWTLRLESKKEEEKRWVGVFHNIQKPKASNCPKDLHSKFSVHLKNKEGKPIWRGETVKEVTTLTGGGWGFAKMVDADAFAEESLSIHISFKLYTCSSGPKPLADVGEELRQKFVTNLQPHMIDLLQNPTPFSSIKMVSSDGREFLVYGGILAVRSPVFEAMLRTDMLEAKDGVIKLRDLSGKTLEVLLHFLYAGQLHPDWKLSEVIVELTYAAAKYQLNDLLKFLDSMLGTVCDLQTAGALMTLAHQLELEIAQEEILKFVRNKGVSSPARFGQVLGSLSSLESFQVDQLSPSSLDVDVDQESSTSGTPPRRTYRKKKSTKKKAGN